MKDKKNIFLFVLGISTLLIMVVGATYAYFQSTGAGSDASVLNVTTSSVDAFSSTVGVINLPVTLADMQETNGVNDYTNYKEASGFIELTVTPGSDTEERVCTYDIVYIPTDVFTNSSTNTTNLLELSIKGSGIQNSAINIGSITETSLSGVSSKINLASNLEFTYTNGSQNVIRWNFDVRFYNLAIDQSENAGRTFGGEIKIDNLSCNGSNVDTGSETKVSLINYLLTNHTEDDGLIQHTSSIVTSAGDNNYRYSGGNDIVTENYVCFGSDEEVCPKENLFRILGIYNLNGENKTKLVKAYHIDKNEDGIYEAKLSQVDAFQFDAGNDARWEGENTSDVSDDADINIYLNGEYLNEFSMKYQEMISAENLNLGALTEINGKTSNIYDFVVTPLAAIALEEEVVTVNKYKIGLINASDFGYSGLESNWIHTLRNINRTLYATDTLWLHYTDQNEWLINNEGAIWNAEVYFGDIYSPTYPNIYRNIRPALYLNNLVKYVSGNGTESDPFRISM